MKRLILVFSALIFLASCNNKQPKAGIITQDKMVAVLTDIHLADGYLSSFMQSDTLKQKGSGYYAAIYKHYKIDSLSYKKSLQYYSRNPKLLDTMYHKVTSNIETMLNAENELASEKRMYEDKYRVLKEETNGTLFKPYDIWFFKFSMPESIKPPMATTITHHPSPDSVKVLINESKQKGIADSTANSLKNNYLKRMRQAPKPKVKRKI